MVGVLPGLEEDALIGTDDSCWKVLTRQALNEAEEGDDIPCNGSTDNES